jgi:hypothetical protein
LFPPKLNGPNPQESTAMKLLLSIACFLFIFTQLVAQSSEPLTGDWMRVTATRADGRELPFDHPSRTIQRYYFLKDKVLVVMGSSTTPMEYSLTGNQLKLGPVQTFTVEKKSEREMTFMEAKNSIRYYFIPTDSFTVSGIVKYPLTISASDTIYTNTIGIEPLYPQGTMAFMKYIMEGFGSVEVSFEFTYVVQKDGTIGEVQVPVSTNEKMNKRLIQLIKKSSGKWIPGAMHGKPLNVKMKGNLSLTRSRSY